jgi:hypothetical protein
VPYARRSLFAATLVAIACQQASTPRAGGAYGPNKLPFLDYDTSDARGVTNADVGTVALSRWARRQHKPWFSDLAARDTQPMHPAAPLLADPGARRYRTPIRAGAAAGPNFAGHYTVVSMGCGSPCTVVAIVDARTSHVYMQESAFASWPPLFRRDSRLLIDDPTGIVTTAEGVPWWNSTIYYYEWSGTRLILRDSLDARRVRIPSKGLPN